MENNRARQAAARLHPTLETTAADPSAHSHVLPGTCAHFGELAVHTRRPVLK